MPAPGAHGGGGGGGAGGENYWETLIKLSEKFKKAQEEVTKARDFDIESVNRKRRATNDQINSLKAELDLEKAGTQAYHKKADEIRDQIAKIRKLNEEIHKLSEEKRKEYELDEKKEKAGLRRARNLKEYSSLITNSVSGYYHYNLEVQKAIDQAGRSTAAVRKSAAEFEHLRQTLHLTRQAALEFSGAWSDALRLGATNAQLEKMALNLQRVHGQAAGLAMAKQVIAAPLSRTTYQGVMRGDTGAVARALRVVTPEQGQALVGTLRRAGGRSEATQEAARFQIAEAHIAKAMDDVKMAITAGAAAGISPEISAMIGPLSDINEKMRQLVINTDPFRLWALGAGKSALATAGGGIGTKAMLTGAGRLAIVGGKFLGPAALALGAGHGAGAGLDYLAGKQEKGSNMQKGLGYAGSAARIAGYAGTGALLGGGIPGAIGGAVVGAAIEFREPFLDTMKIGSNYFLREFITGSDYFSTKAKEAINPEDRGMNQFADALNEWKVANDTAMQQMGYLTAELEKMPEAIHGRLAERTLEVGKGAIDTNAFQGAIEEIAASSFARMEKAGIDFNKKIKEAENKRDIAINNLIGSKKMTPELEKRAQEIREGYDVTIGTLQEGLQGTLKNLDLGKPAREAMERMETRRGQVGQEREAATTRFQRTGALTGRHEETVAYQKAINESYKKETELIEEGNREAIKQLDAADKRVAKQIEQAQNDVVLTKVYEKDALNLTVQRQQQARIIAVQKENLELSRQTAELEAKRFELMEYERTAVFKRAEMTRTLAQTRGAFLKERGANPEEIGAEAQKAATAAQAAFAEYSRDSTEKIKNMQDEATKLWNAGEVGKALQIEKSINDYRISGVTLEKEVFESRMAAASDAEQYRQEQIGAQKRILEIQRDSAGKMGASWRVQMGYQAQIIRASQADLASSRRELNQMVAQGVDLQSPKYLNKLSEVTQKQANLQEAILGRQRSFLEQAIGIGFGMGGGTKAQPNINPRMFGELVQGPTGIRQPGMPLTMGQQRQLLMQAAGGQIRGGIGGGGLGAVPMLPGAGGPAGGLGGVPGGPGGGGGVGPEASNVDVSGRIQVAVNLNMELFTAAVQREIRLSVKPGSRV